MEVGQSWAVELESSPIELMSLVPSIGDSGSLEVIVASVGHANADVGVFHGFKRSKY